MREPDSFNAIEYEIHAVLDKISNNEYVDIKSEWIEQAGEQFKEAIRRQVKVTDKEFSLRMSNIGKPTCQLLAEKEQHPRERYPYNHSVRMLIGDAVESIIRLIIKATNINVTGSGEKVRLDVNGFIINGTDDIEIDDAIYDVKSASPYSYKYKFGNGFQNLFLNDDFGYVGQLYGYAKGRKKRMGGWVVIDKSSGEVMVLEAAPTPDQINQIETCLSFNEASVRNQVTFKKSFEPEVEFFRKKPTGNLLVPQICTMCPFLKAHWPDAVMKPQAQSNAKEPKRVWYSEYHAHKSKPVKKKEI
jgi:hypothetical protein